MSKSKYGTKCITFIDNGLFIELAIKLSEDFGKVNYYSCWENAFPRSNQRMVGEGIPGVTRCNDWAAAVDETDVFAFPDIYWGGTELLLEEKLGKRVWGSRMGEQLEILRDASKEYFKKLGLPVGKYEVIIGLAALRKYLKENDNQWVKCNGTRGDFESFFAKNYKNIEPKLDELEHNLGAKKLVMKFIVEEDLDHRVEIGYDGYCVDGQFPQRGIAGIEIKNLGYAGYVRNYDDLPKEMTDFNVKIAAAMKKYRYRNFFSTEFRIGEDHVPYMIDACCRAGSPPSELYQNMIDNLADIVWEGAGGKLVQPVYNARCGVEIMIESAWADSNWQAITFPPKIRDNVKLRNLTIINGEYYVVPQATGMPEIGSVVATGDTIEEAGEKAKEICKQIEGYYIHFPEESIDKAKAEFDKLEAAGIKI